MSFRGGRFIHPVPGVQGGSGAPNGELYVNGERQEPGIQQTLGREIGSSAPPGGGGFGGPLSARKRPFSGICVRDW